MNPVTEPDPGAFIAGFFTSLTADLLRDDTDAAEIIDRYHTPDIIEFSDGIRMDRAKLIAHTRPIRKNRPEGRVEVHEAYATGEHLAARYTMHVTQRGKRLAIDVHFFGRFTPDGRMREAHMLTRSNSA